MSRALQLSKSYYQSNFNVSLKLPIAWCAPECIHDLQFSTASDIWAYGVTLWEMFTYGFTPWAGLTGRQVLEAIDVPRSARLDQPDACPDAIYDAVMRACWTHEPRARPTFSHLVDGTKRSAIDLGRLQPRTKLDIEQTATVWLVLTYDTYFLDTKEIYAAAAARS
ncbi:hypothetical protein X801_03514 [Opisthorchis viverrini]|uniref:Protein kinase domain-containing protein n=1 Tax=Opisthorchis viverrini TaxID=6198 RepID=A0A1S8X1L2_OPIVI|nr:hypothetical protein X801_03514 [Opisthorchis viverrini]